MTERDPDKFLASLTDAFRKRLEMDSTVKSQFHYFEASKEAVSVRLCALDRLAAQCPISSQNTNVDLGKRQERNQVLFDFFSNASAVIESFCCGSYFVGSVLDSANFPLVTLSNNVMTELRKINPKKTKTAYNSFAPQSPFTKRLQVLLDSNEYELISSMRNLLVHRMVPGLTIQLQPTGATHAIDLDLWYDGEVRRCYGGALPPAKRMFDLDDACLSTQRNWIDDSIHDLSEELSQFAATKGLT